MNGDPADAAPNLIALEDAAPHVALSSWIAPNARLVGDVKIGESSSVFYGAVLRGDLDRISIGSRTNVQDNVVMHVDPGHPVLVGDDVSIGHTAILHGCDVGDGTVVGMGASILNGATIGRESLVAAGAVVLEGTVIPEGSLVAGVPGKVRRALTSEERSGLRDNARVYMGLAERHRRAGLPR